MDQAPYNVKEVTVKFMRWSRLGSLSTIVASLALLAACGGGGHSSGGGSNPADFTLAVSNSPQTVVAGNSTTYTVGITPVNGFAGAVAFSASGVPTGATASFSAVSGGSSTLTVTTTTATAAATSTITVTGTSGSLTHSGTASLIVTPAPDFTVSFAPSTYTVTAGGSADYTVTVGALNGFTGTVTLAGSNLPSGVNGFFLPATVAGSGTAKLVVTTPASQAPSTSSFSVTGSSNGLTHSASGSLTITAPTGSFSLSASPFQETVMAGGATAYQITLTPSSGFTQNVALAADPATVPSGATVTFTPSTITGGAGTSTMLVSTASSASVCCARISVTGVATSNQTSAITLPLAIVAATANRINKVFLIAMQTQDWASVKGSVNAPYINSFLLAAGSHAEQYFNPPSIHPDLPNYLWLETGSNLGITDNNVPLINHQSTTGHLSSLLTVAGKTWKSYVEGIDGTTCPLTSDPTNQYAVYTNPFVYFDDVTTTNNVNSPTCIAHVRPFTELITDLQNNTVADYNFITPNQLDSMGSGSSVALGDTWLAANLPAILNSPAYQDGGVVLITWNQAATVDGPIGMIVLSPNAKGGSYQNSVLYNHGSTLRSEEEIFAVTPFLNDAVNQADLSDLFVTFP
ncbi:MAG TPA: alkaline phosphatase family protein [Candidatus Sulfotelmatobacter sp.]